VRELENVLGCACMMAEADAVDVRDLPERFHGPAPRAPGKDEELVTLDEAQRRHARRVLERAGGNKAQAAEILGVSRSTVYCLLAEKDPEPRIKP
jgi:transcriptional regulator of acetoin/glycerol metabolism